MYKYKNSRSFKGKIIKIRFKSIEKIDQSNILKNKRKRERVCACEREGEKEGRKIGGAAKSRGQFSISLSYREWHFSRDRSRFN